MDICGKSGANTCNNDYIVMLYSCSYQIKTNGLCPYKLTLDNALPYRFTSDGMPYLYLPYQLYNRVLNGYGVAG